MMTVRWTGLSSRSSNTPLCTEDDTKKGITENVIAGKAIIENSITENAIAGKAIIENGIIQNSSAEKRHSQTALLP